MTHHTPPASGTVCRVPRERGTFTYLHESRSASGAVSWWLIDFDQQRRAFRPERVTVPTKKKPKQLQLEEQIG